jgi:hypothetical protein
MAIEWNAINRRKDMLQEERDKKQAALIKSRKKQEEKEARERKAAELKRQQEATEQADLDRIRDQEEHQRTEEMMAYIKVRQAVGRIYFLITQTNCFISEVQEGFATGFVQTVSVGTCPLGSETRVDLTTWISG